MTVQVSPASATAGAGALREAVWAALGTVLDPELDGTPWHAVVHVNTAIDVDSPGMEEGFAAIPAVVEVLDLAGTIDYEIRVRGRTQPELYEAIQQIRLLPGVTSIETRMVMRRVLRR